MTVASDLAAVEANSGLTDEQKRAARYDIKNVALIDVILNGKPSPNPIPPLINRTFTAHGGKTYTVRSAVATTDKALKIMVEINGTPHMLFIKNPPCLPQSITGNEKQDLIQAAIEMMEGFG